MDVVRTAAKDIENARAHYPAKKLAISREDRTINNDHVSQFESKPKTHCDSV